MRNTAGHNLTDETGEAKLNKIHTVPETVRVKQESPHTEKQTKTQGLDIGTRKKQA